MPLFTISEARTAGRALASRKMKTADRIVRDLHESYTSTKSFDIFLSHSFSDAELILGVWELLTDRGFSVYVDWLIDPILDRENVTPATAAKLRERMKSCSCLVYASSENTTTSKWMPWELGYFDGFRPKKVAVLPLVYATTEDYRGQEYLGLYPYISIGEIKDQPSKGQVLWVNESLSVYVNFSSWLNSDSQPRHH